MHYSDLSDNTLLYSAPHDNWWEDLSEEEIEVAERVADREINRWARRDERGEITT